MDPAGILLQIDVFAELRAGEVAELGPDLRERTFDRGQPLWIEGDPALDLYILVDGQIKAHRTGIDGGEVILGIYRHIDLIGEVGLFHPTGIRRLSTTAMTRSRCLYVARAPLVAFLARHPSAMERMLGRLAFIAGHAAYSFTGLAFDDIRRRVAGALLALGSEFGEPSAEHGVRIRLRLSQSTLAELVAASRENVNRALTTFVAAGAVGRRDGHFHLLDLRALQEIASSRPEL